MRGPSARSNPCASSPPPRRASPSRRPPMSNSTSASWTKPTQARPRGSTSASPRTWKDPNSSKAKSPRTRDRPGAPSLRVRSAVSPDGQPKNFQTFETNNGEWADRALQEMADWRFRPAMREGQPEQVNGIFELAVSQPQAPENRPTLRRSLVTISPPEPQDSSLPAPKPISPPDHAIFD